MRRDEFIHTSGAFEDMTSRAVACRWTPATFCRPLAPPYNRLVTSDKHLGRDSGEWNIDFLHYTLHAAKSCASTLCYPSDHNHQTTRAHGAAQTRRGERRSEVDSRQLILLLHT
jgi:hypothetical protein